MGLTRSLLRFLFQPVPQEALPTLFAATSPLARPGAYCGPDRLGEVVARLESFGRQAEKRIRLLQSATGLNDLAQLPGNRLEALQGDRKGQFGIRINRQWRICFTWPEGAGGPGNVGITEPELWMNLQQIDELDLARQRVGEAIARLPARATMAVAGPQR